MKESELWSTGLLGMSDAMTHMLNGGQVFRITQKDRFFYKIEAGVLMCRCNEIGGWYPAVAPLRDSDKLYVAAEDYKTEGFGREYRVVRTQLPLPTTTLTLSRKSL